MQVEVAEDYDAIFRTVWVAFFVFFDFRNGHGGKSVADNGTEDLVFGFSDIFPSLGCLMKAEVFLKIGFVPNFCHFLTLTYGCAIWVRIGNRGCLLRRGGLMR